MSDDELRQVIETNFRLLSLGFRESATQMKANGARMDEMAEEVHVGAPVRSSGELVARRGAPACARRWRAWVGGFALADNLVMAGTEMGNTFPGQRPTGGSHFMTDVDLQINQALCPRRTHFLEEAGQLPQVVGVAQPMLAQQFAVRFPADLNQGARKPR